MNKNGFTLIELIVAMAIISIMSAVVIVQYNGYRDSKALTLGEKQIINDIRMVQGRTYNILSNNGSFPEGGYGIRFTNGSDNYIIFADNDDNSVYDAGEEFETIELPENVEIVGLKKDGVDNSPVDIVFKPPYGKVLIDTKEKSGSSFIKLEIEIKNKSGFTKIIEVSSSRLIK